MSLSLFFYIIATILLVLAAIGVGVRRVSLGWLGLALWLFTYALLPHLT
jgi:hypothetical protein